jgi:signal transduction histidine kinase/CheY-like chemotaxis protein
VLVGGLFALVAVATYRFDARLLLFWYAPLVVVAAVLLGWWAGGSSAALASALALLAHGGPEFDGVTASALLMIWVSLALAWLLSHPTHLALAWAWHSYVRAARINEELRDHQEQLGRTVKSLKLAYDHLEQLNLELARARRAAEEARRLKADFAAAISHELRTPLNLIIGFTEMMVSSPQAYGDEVLPAAYRGDLEAVYRNAGHLSGLVDDVLDLSQIEADRMGLQKERIHIAPIVDEALTTIARLFEAKGLTVTVDVPLDLPPVEADRTRIRQILINLLNNAVRFTARGGVTIRARCEGSDVIVAVADTGVGIAPEHVSIVFEEFRQVQVLGERRTVGSGLGLAVSKRFVELHGGSMWVESKLGEGSTFFFSLPYGQSVIASPHATRGDHWALSAEARSPKGTILVVGGDGEAGRLFARHLDGYQVVAAQNVEAVRRLELDHAPRAVVVAGSGTSPDWNTIRQAGQVFPDRPIVISSFNRRRFTPRALDVVDCLEKPVTREGIRRALGRLGRGVRRILVVDDDPEMVRLIARLVRLSSRRYDVAEAESGDEAQRLMQTQRPDAVLLDLLMPGLRGDELLEWMRRTPGLIDVPVILITGRGLTDETIAVEFYGIVQPGGLTVRELMRCLGSDLEIVHRPEAVEAEDVQQRLAADRLGQEVGRAQGEGEGPLVDDGADDDRDVPRSGVALERL